MKGEDIFRVLLKARKQLREGNVPFCDECLIVAEGKLHEAIHKAKWWWRFFNVYAFHLWIYFIGMLFSIFIFYNFVGSEMDYTRDGNVFLFAGIPLLAVQAVIWGMIGGLFQDIWFLWKHVQNRDYRNTWMVQYFSAPFIGGILGAIIYIIIIAGLIILDSDTSGAPREFVVLALAAFAGYNWDWAIKRFEGMARKIQE